MIVDSDLNEAAAGQAEKEGTEGAAATVKTEQEAASNAAENKNSSPDKEAATEQSKAAVSASKPGSKPISKQGSAEFKSKPAASEAGAASADIEMKEPETDVKVEAVAAASGAPKKEDVEKDLAEDK